MKDEKTYRIAFFTVDWNYELVESTLHGLKQYTDDHPNVYISVFDCFGKNLDNAKDKSEYAIFNLADLSQFDGLLIQGNQIVLQRVRDEVGARITETGIPAVSIGCPMPGCTLMRIDDGQAEFDITTHVIRHHHARNLVYITGIMDNSCPEALQRLDGFRRACRENGIPESQMQIVNGTWQNADGRRIAREWLEEKRPLPDAFVVANDEMAMGLMDTFRDAGLRIPGDVVVTGFDNLTTAELSSPRLSTVATDHRALNYAAMDVLVDRIDREDVPEEIPFHYSIVCSESCGCRERARPGMVREKYFQQARFLRRFYTVQDQMAEELFEANNLQDIAAIVKRNRAIFGCDDIGLCFNDYYYDNFDKDQWLQDSERFGQEMVIAAYEDEPSVAGSKVSFLRFPTRQLLPDFLRDQEHFVIYYPLHYNTYSIGYIALDGISEAAKLNLHESIFNFLEIAIENVRKKELLRQFNAILDNLYVHDALTGLYNRFGFGRYARDCFDRLLARDGSVQVLFADLDYMKEINDQYGHDLGDEALKAVSRILQQCCGPEDFLMRYGGDEFVIIASGRDRKLADKIMSAAENYNNISVHPFHLGISAGAYRTEAPNPDSLETCLTRADEEMYKVKTARKAGR